LTEEGKNAIEYPTSPTFDWGPEFYRLGKSLYFKN